MPGGRRLPRTARSPLPSSFTLISGEVGGNRYSPLAPTLPGLDHPIAPKHYPFPNIPVDSDLLFEFMMYFFTVFAAGLQFLHMYRSAWWLQHSYMNQAVNFYLIDPYLVLFIVVILSRRLLYIIGCKILEKCTPMKFHDFEYSCFRSLLFIIMVPVLCWSSYKFIQNYSYVHLGHLFCPFVMYILLFGFNIGPFFELVNWNPGEKPPLHACTSDTSQIRSEAEHLKDNFNNRMKHILFSSAFNAYYAGYIPTCFVQNFVYYDVAWTTQHLFFIYESCFTAYVVHMLPSKYCDILHRSTLHLGHWEKEEKRSGLPVPYIWNEDVLCPHNILVKHGRDVYRAQGESNAAEPGNATYTRFYLMFKNPSIPFGALVFAHIVIILYQLVVLCRTVYWHNVLSLGFVMFYNYYTLYKIFRDYLISLRVYKAEKALHEKGNFH